MTDIPQHEPLIHYRGVPHTPEVDAYIRECCDSVTTDTDCEGAEWEVELRPANGQILVSVRVRGREGWEVTERGGDPMLAVRRAFSQLFHARLARSSLAPPRISWRSW